MTATTPTAFDPAPKHLGTVLTMTAGSAILSGQIVAFAATDDGCVDPATSSLSCPIGIAGNSAAAGAPVTVYSQGCVVKVELSADDGTADQGDWLSVSTVAGCAIVADTAIATHDSQVAGLYPIGIAVEAIAAGAATVGGRGYMLVNITPIWTAAS
jgi:hypothetical protein